jgi:hypothetical protein
MDGSNNRGAAAGFVAGKRLALAACRRRCNCAPGSSSLLPEGALLFTGGLHRTAEADGTARIFNSLMVLGKPGQVLARHDKVRLVPFGEFLPFSFILEPLGIRQLARLPSGFSEGAADRVIKVPGVTTFCRVYLLRGGISPFHSLPGRARAADKRDE